MTAKTPLPILAYLLIAASLSALLVISNKIASANNRAPVTVSTNTAMRGKTAIPTTTSSATPTCSPTPTPPTPTLTPSERLSPPAEVIFDKLLLELKPRIKTVVPTPTWPRPTRTPSPPATDWPSTPVGKALVVDQDAQLLHVYEDGIEIRALPVSTGVPPLYTPAFRGRVGRYASTIYGYGELADNGWYVFTAGGNIYIHSAPYTLSEGVKTYTGLEALGVRPSSHGCIRLYPADAEWLTAWGPRGATILITPLDLSKEW